LNLTMLSRARLRNFYSLRSYRRVEH
jgi:hypothetical protein